MKTNRQLSDKRICDLLVELRARTEAQSKARKFDCVDLKSDSQVDSRKLLLCLAKTAGFLLNVPCQQTTTLNSEKR